jgi:hypothetical protein
MRLAGACLLVAGAAWGHDLYLMPDSFVVKAGARVSVSMHNGDEFPESDGPPALARLRDSSVVSAKGQAAMENVRAEQKRGRAEYTAPAGGFVLMTRTIPHFIDLSPESFHDYLEHEGLGWVVEWRKKNGEAGARGRELYSKHAKAVVHAGAGARRGDEAGGPRGGDRAAAGPGFDQARRNAAVSGVVPGKARGRDGGGGGAHRRLGETDDGRAGARVGGGEPRRPLEAAHHQDGTARAARESGLGELLGEYDV